VKDEIDGKWIVPLAGLIVLGKCGNDRFSLFCGWGWMFLSLQTTTTTKNQKKRKKAKKKNQ